MFNRTPRDNYPDDYESRAYQHYQESFHPGIFMWLREFSSYLMFAVWVFIFAGMGLLVAWIALPPQEPRIVIVTPAFSPTGDIMGDFPADVSQQFITVPARIDHVLGLGQKHGYRFFLDPGLTWIMTVYSDGTLDPQLSLYGPDGVIIQLDDDSGGDGISSQISFQAPVSGQYALLIQSAGDGSSSGGYTLTVMPVR
ncbi:MAG: hypothetical protein KJ064_25205 [Anaerolineae bacterium]|nr:hypothetical protein [Anaerolineae bacterium]